MRLTNKLGLPDIIVRAISNDPYTRGESDISVTQLIAPAFQRRLMETEEKVEDVADRIYSLLGSSVHGVIERAASPDDIVEERFFYEVGGKVVSGQCDLLRDGTLYDFKVTSVWSAINGGKKEWEQQLNLLRFLAGMKALRSGDDRYITESLKIVAIFRDFQKSKAGKDGYPDAGVALIDIPVWPLTDAANYLEERVRAHFAPEPAHCTDEERWATPEVFALMKKDRKSAVKLYDVREEAEKAAAAKGKDHFVEIRPQTFRRCEDYCSVSHACPIHNRKGF